MVDLIIIGNGFDLAHDIPTKFSDFLKWYYEWARSTPNCFFTSSGPLIKNIREQGITSQEFVELNFDPRTVEFCHSFIKKLVYGHTELNWEGLEREYYKSLLQCESETQVVQLNDCFEELRLAFIKYITGLCRAGVFSWDDSIAERFNTIYNNNFDSNKNEYGQIIWINFNYTPFAENYFEKIIYNNQEYSNISKFIYIHGRAADPKSIIFGYGDESDPKYLSIEQENNNQYLRYLKSFMYLNSENYRNLVNSLVNVEYRVNIMGHSCGLSDRVLLKEIFCRPECKEITIYYYRNKEAKTNDYIDKVMNISRVFPLEEKSELRFKVLPYSRCRPLSL